jgi:phosphatidylserine decarboxylase
MTNLIILAGLAALTSTFWYLYLHKKTRISLKYLYIDNIIVVLLTVLVSYIVNSFSVLGYFVFLIPIILVFGFSFLLTMYRFWRTPNRQIKAIQGEIVSPADGNVIYIKEVKAGDTPISIKNGLEAKLSEIAETELLDQDGWLIGINMTPFDVHKNCAPVSGNIILNKHINGEFLSLKHPKALIQNERNTLIIKTDQNEHFGIIQTASKLVKRIDSYVKEKDSIKQGDWFGMIRFGSQVDVIMPKSYKINLELGQQVYAKTTIIASK